MQLAEEPYDVYNERPVTARQPHVCAACRESIQTGQRYVRVAMVYDGTAETLKRCERCQAIHLHLRDENPDRYETWPDERLDCGETYEDVFGEPPPNDIAALAFWRPGDPPVCLPSSKESA